MDDTDQYPELTDDQWRAKFIEEAAGRGPFADFLDPNAIMKPKDVAKVIGTSVDAIYHYRRTKNIIEPDLQVGGRKPRPGELITWRGKTSRHELADGSVVYYPVKNSRRPLPGEMIRPREVGWYAWRIFRWAGWERPGRGWHDKGKARKPLAKRARWRIGPGEWVPPPKDAEPVWLPPPEDWTPKPRKKPGPRKAVVAPE